MTSQLELFPDHRPGAPLSSAEFATALEAFRDFGTATEVLDFPDPDFRIPVYVNEFWTARQRAASSLHEVSYRACFKPQLPRFFITRLTAPSDRVYDPFMGRGTTLLEAGMLGRRAAGCDVNPLSEILVAPRFQPPRWRAVAERLEQIDLESPAPLREELLVFYHERTLRQITRLRHYLLEREADGTLDAVDAWIRMVATNRLTGHSPGFFSVYTLPPNQAVSAASQARINQKRNQTPPPREVRRIIVRKTRSLLNRLEPPNLDHLCRSAPPLIITGSCEATLEIGDETIALVVTSPPFLDVVDYQADNWLRCWFNGIDVARVAIWQWKDPQDWQAAMGRVFVELRRVLRPGGHVAFEVGEVRRGQVLMETLVVPAAVAAGLHPVLVMVNAQEFTKTSNCWGVDNQRKGTNTNRIVLLEKR